MLWSKARLTGVNQGVQLMQFKTIRVKCNLFSWLPQTTSGIYPQHCSNVPCHAQYQAMQLQPDSDSWSARCGCLYETSSWPTSDRWDSGDEMVLVAPNSPITCNAASHKSKFHVDVDRNETVFHSPSPHYTWIQKSCKIADMQCPQVLARVTGKVLDSLASSQQGHQSYFARHQPRYVEPHFSHLPGKRQPARSVSSLTSQVSAHELL